MVDGVGVGGFGVVAAGGCGPGGGAVVVALDVPAVGVFGDVVGFAQWVQVWGEVVPPACQLVMWSRWLCRAVRWQPGMRQCWSRVMTWSARSCGGR